MKDLKTCKYFNRINSIETPEQCYGCVNGSHYQAN